MKEFPERAGSEFFKKIYSFCQKLANENKKTVSHCISKNSGLELKTWLKLLDIEKERYVCDDGWDMGEDGCEHWIKEYHPQVEE